MRRRLAAAFISYGELVRLGHIIEKELGIDIDSDCGYDFFWPPFLEKAELRDVLDSVTMRYLTIVDMYSRPDSKHRSEFIENISRIFKEESVHYRVDDKGGVHFAVDADFENSRVATIAHLGKQRYVAVRSNYEEAFSALDRTPPDGKAAIRSAFFAVEGLFRLIFNNAHQLSAAEVQKHLKPLVDQKYDGQKPAIHLAQKQVAAFSDWIDGAHFYRHEPGTEEPAQPPLSLAIYMVAQAGAHLRWLADFDNA